MDPATASSLLDVIMDADPGTPCGPISAPSADVLGVTLTRNGRYVGWKECGVQVLLEDAEKKMGDAARWSIVMAALAGATRVELQLAVVDCPRAPAYLARRSGAVAQLVRLYCENEDVISTAVRGCLNPLLSLVRISNSMTITRKSAGYIWREPGLQVADVHVATLLGAGVAGSVSGVLHAVGGTLVVTVDQARMVDVYAALLLARGPDLAVQWCLQQWATIQMARESTCDPPDDTHIRMTSLITSRVLGNLRMPAALLRVAEGIHGCVLETMLHLQHTVMRLSAAGRVCVGDLVQTAKLCVKPTTPYGKCWQEAQEVLGIQSLVIPCAAGDAKGEHIVTLGDEQRLYFPVDYARLHLVCLFSDTLQDADRHTAPACVRDVWRVILQP